MELLIEPFHITSTKSTRGYRQQIKLGGMEKIGKTFYQEVNDVMQQYTEKLIEAEVSTAEDMKQFKVHSE